MVRSHPRISEGNFFLKRLLNVSTAPAAGGNGCGIGFALTPSQTELQQRVRSFIRDRVIPLERECVQDRTSHGPSRALRDRLVALGKQEGLYTHQLRYDSTVTRGIVLEESGYSTLGPIALGVQAPDEGNAHLMSVIATEPQKRKYLDKLLDGTWTSCFCMTEPSPGAGSDPRAIKTTATPVDGSLEQFRINGKKWLITGANEAGFCIVMAVVPDKGATMFLSKMDAPGIKLTRTLDTMDSSFFGGHSVVEFQDVKVSKEDVLGEIGKGLEYAQVRLAPARLTHCMRWLGAATRCHDEATKYAINRESFGKPIIDHQGVSFQLADNVIDLHACRLMVWHCAWFLDQVKTHAEHNEARRISSMCKVFVSEKLYSIADRSLQVMGGLGVTDDAEVQRIFRDLRAFRVYDGTSEV